MPYRETNLTAPRPPVVLPERYHPRTRFATRMFMNAPVVATLTICAVVFSRLGSIVDGTEHFEWLLGALVGTITCALFFFYHLVKQRRGIVALNESAALTRGSGVEASMAYAEELLVRYARYGNVQAVVLSNLSVGYYTLGELDKALAILDAIEAAGWTGPRAALRPIVQQNRGLYLACLGDVEGATRCRNEARQRMSAARAESSLFILDLVIAARSGKLAEVLSATSTVDGARRLQNRIARILRAHALDAEPASDARADEIRVLLDGARPVAAGELWHFTAEWPQLDAFLRARGFADAVTRK